MGFPTTLQEFQVAFPDEQACWEALRRACWPRGFVCPPRELPDGLDDSAPTSLGAPLPPRSRPAGLVEVDETYVGDHKRGRRGGREVLQKGIEAVEQRSRSAGRARLSVLKGVRYELDLDPFIRAGIDLHRDALPVEVDRIGSRPAPGEGS